MACGRKCQKAQSCKVLLSTLYTVEELENQIDSLLSEGYELKASTLANGGWCLIFITEKDLQ